MALVNCPECSKEISDKATACPNCGTPLKEAQQPIQQVFVNQPKKKSKLKGCISIILILFVATIVMAITSSSMNDANTNNINQSASTSEIKPTATPMPEAIEGEGDIGDYHVIIKEIELAKDYAGKPAIVVTYEWTNNSDEAKAFGYVIDDKAFQNGIECESSIIKIVTDEYDGKYKEIKPGKTLEFKYGYLLNDTQSDVEVELQPLISFLRSPTTISKTFELE